MEVQKASVPILLHFPAYFLIKEQSVFHLPVSTQYADSESHDKPYNHTKWLTHQLAWQASFSLRSLKWLFTHPTYLSHYKLYLSLGCVAWEKNSTQALLNKLKSIKDTTSIAAVANSVTSGAISLCQEEWFWPKTVKSYILCWLYLEV